MSTRPVPIEVFYSYAYVDEPFCKKLDDHLGVLKREGLITTWHQRLVISGQDWKKIVDDHLDTASIILLLISSDFVASDYCYGVEMQRAMQRHEVGEARVIPILLRPVDNWQGTLFGTLKMLPSNGTPVVLWRNRDKAFADIAQGIRLALADVQRLVVITPSTDLPRIWNIPYLRNPFFTGQANVLTQLTNALKVGQSAALSQPQAINGLGGIGKTQIATEYAYQHHQDYQAVLWTLADTREALVSGYITIAHLLNLPEKDEQDQGITVKAVIRWLKTHTKWLLILDSADELDVVREFIPPVFGGHMLITTRAQVTGKLARRIEVVSMPQDIGALLLLRRAQLLAPEAPLADADASNILTAKEISEELGGLPLALDQAGAYIEETSCSLAGYLDLYHTRRADMLKRRGGSASDYPESVATTWSLSFEKVEQRCPAAGDLLRLCAFLSPDAIPESIITQGAADLGSLLAQASADSFLLDQAVETLRAYSLIQRDPRTRTLSVHRLVQAVLKEAMGAEMKTQWAERTVKAVNAAFPSVEFTTWPQWERYLSHVLVCANLVEQEQMKSLEAARLLNNAGQYLYHRARYIEAEPLHRRALTIREQQLGGDHASTAESLNNLAALYWAQGRYGEAEPLHRRALEVYEQQLRLSHPNTAMSLSHLAMSLNNLAELYRTQGRYGEAEPLFERALTIREKQLGTLHPDTAVSLHTLASLYYNQGKYEQAEPLFERALSIKEQSLGSDHPSTAASLSWLAVVYQRQQQYEKAESLYRRALLIFERQWGPDHPGVAASLHSLAELYRMQGRYREAEPLHKRALAIREEQLGVTHPDTAVSVHNLALLYHQQGRYAEAEPMLRRALEIYEEHLGPHHPNLAQGLNNLAALYGRQGKYAEAEPMLRRALEIYEEQLGPHHPDMAQGLNNLAALYDTQGKSSENRTEQMVG